MSGTGWQDDGSYVPCPGCRWEPLARRNPGPGVPVRLPGTTHYGDCPVVQVFTRKEQREMMAKLGEMDRIRRRGAAEAAFYVSGTMTDMSSVAVYPFGRTSSNAAAPSIPSAANSSAPVPHDMPVSISERQRYYWTARWQTDEAESLSAE